MSMEIHAFMELAKEAKAVYHIRRMEQVIISLLTKWKEESSTAFVKPDVEWFGYLELDQEVIKAVEKRGSQDRVEKIPERSVDQLVEFIIAEGLLPKERTDPVKYELHMDYTLAYEYYDAGREKRNKDKERRGI